MQSVKADGCIRASEREVGGGTGEGEGGEGRVLGRHLLRHLLAVCLEVVFYSVLVKFSDRLGDTFIQVNHHCFIG